MADDTNRHMETHIIMGGTRVRPMDIIIQDIMNMERRTMVGHPLTHGINLMAMGTAPHFIPTRTRCTGHKATAKYIKSLAHNGFIKVGAIMGEHRFTQVMAIRL